MSDDPQLPQQPHQSTSEGPRDITWRTPLSSIPGADRIKDGLLQNGFGDEVAVAEAHLEVDTGAMKLAALFTYGMLEQGRHPIFPERFNPLDLLDFEPNEWILRNAPGPYALEDLALDVRDEMLKRVFPSWEGDAFEAFDGYIEKLRRVTNLEAERLRTIGSALYKVADAIEQANEETETTFLGAAGIADTASGFFGAAGWANLLTAVAGAVVAAGQMVEEQSGIAARLAASETGSTVTITQPEYMVDSPSDGLSEYAYPKDPSKWKINDD
jgi:uncharacterized protein YukE